mmetsp:Transcript_1695/g.3644  ORF Transcript_1695/g.3644 Transcript_1695/m.3644 type:complete len:755 (+) Transcript_1695:289-2553(+)
MPRNRQSLPTTKNNNTAKKQPSSNSSDKGGGTSRKASRKTTRSRSKENRLKVGTRSGARFHPSRVSKDDNGLENMEGFFKAQDEEQSSTQTENSSSASRAGAAEGREGALKTGKLKKRHKPKTPKKVRMSVGGDDDDEFDDDSVDSQKKMAARKQPTEKEETTNHLNKEDAEKLTQDYFNKVKSTVTSPSELSKVSTAPPTPFEEEEQETARFAKDDQEEEDDDEQVDTDGPRAEDGLLTQPTHEDDDDDDDVVLPQASNAGGDQKQPALMERTESPEPSFPPMGLDDLGPPEHSDNDDENSFGLEPPDHSDDDGDDDNDEPDNMQQDEEKGSKQDQLSEDSSSDDDDESREKPEAKQTEEPAPAAAATSDSSSNSDSDDDSDKEGNGYNMVHDPETPASVRKQRAKEEKAALRRNKKKKRKGSDSSSDDSSNDDDESTLQTPVRTKQSKKKKKKRHVAFSPKGMPIANRSYQRKPLDAFAVDFSDDEYDGVRRSRRAKCKPLQFWRNERLEYGAHNETGVLGQVMGDMPVVVNIIKAEETPYKKRKAAKQKKKDDAKKKNQQKQGSGEEVKPYNLSKLKKKYKVVDGEVANLWDELIDDPGDMKVIAYADGLEASDLPLSNQRDEKDGFVVGQAAQAFNIPNDDNDNYVGYIMGNLRLPPKAIKDAESVGPCSQTFTVFSCQPKSLEIAYGDPDLPEGILDPLSAQRFYLSPGDMFRVPPGNCYRLQNRSKTTDAFLTWTIIRPRNVANEDSD